MNTLRASVVVLALVSVGRAGAEPTPKPLVDRSMVVLDFTAPPDLADKARALTTLVTSELIRRPGVKIVTSGDVREVLGVDRQKQLLGCRDGACMAEIGGALGARYILGGQLERFGTKFLLVASVFDAMNAQAVAKSARTVATEDELIGAALATADEVAKSAGFEPRSETAPVAVANSPPAVASPVPAPPTAGLELKLGNTIPALTASKLKLSSLNLRLDLEVDYYATIRFVPFLAASLTLARGSSGESLQFVPVLAGAKYVFRAEASFRPYAGLGLGLGFLSGTLTGQGAQTSFAVYGVGGLAYFPWRRVGFNLDASVNLSGIQVSAQSGLLVAYNLNFGPAFLF